MFTRESTEYERLCSLDVLGVDYRGEDDQLDVYTNEVSVPWITGAEVSNTNKIPSRKRLENVERKLVRNEELKSDYEKIVLEAAYWKSRVLYTSQASSKRERYNDQSEDGV